MVAFMYILALYVGFLYTMMTVLTIVQAEGLAEIVSGILILFPPAVLAIMVVTLRLLG